MRMYKYMCTHMHVHVARALSTLKAPSLKYFKFINNRKQHVQI